MAGKLVRVVSAALLLASLGLAVGCDAWQQQAAPVPKPPFPFPNERMSFVTAADSDDGPKSTRTYDLAEALKAEDADEASPEHLLVTLRASFPPARKLALEGEKLIAELTEQEHADVVRMFEDWRRGGMCQIVVESRFLAPASAAITPIAWNPIPVEKVGSGGPPILAARVTDAQLFQLLSDVQGETRSNVMQAPRVTLVNGQSLTFADVVATPFVTSVVPKQNGAMQPVIETIEEGVRIAIRPSTTGDGQIEVAVELNAAEILEVAEIDLPFRPAQGPPDPVTVQAPTVETCSAKAVVRLASKESFLIAIPGAPDPKHPETPAATSFFIFTPYLLDEEEKTSVASVPAPIR